MFEANVDLVSTLEGNCCGDGELVGRVSGVVWCLSGATYELWLQNCLIYGDPAWSFSFGSVCGDWVFSVGVCYVFLGLSERTYM